MNQPTESPSKYKNKKIVVDGYKFDSRAEARYYEMLKRQGMSFLPLSNVHCTMQENVVLQDDFVLNGKKILKINYRADFIIYDGPNIIKVVDVKGYQDSMSKLKMKMFAKRYGFPVTFAKWNRNTNSFDEMTCFESAKEQGQRAKERAARKALKK